MLKQILRRMAVLMKKELAQLLKDPKTRFMLILPPLLQLFIFGYVATMDLKEADFAVLDHCRSKESRELIAKFSADAVFKRKTDLASENDMRERLSDRKIKFALVIPQNFSRDLASGRPAPVQLNFDGRNSSSAGTALGYAQAILAKYNASRMPQAPRAVLQSRAWYNPNYNARFFMLPSLLAVISLLDVVMLSSLSLAKERENGTLDQLCLTPFSSAEILAGKVLSVLAVGLCQLTGGLLLILFWFQIPFHSSFFTLYLLFAAFVLSAAGFGLLISMLANSLQQAMLMTFMYAIPVVMLSGMISPVESMPQFFQTVTLINPVRHGVRALQLLFLEGTTLRELLPIFGALLGTGILCWGIAVAVFEHRRRR